MADTKTTTEAAKEDDIIVNIEPDRKEHPDITVEVVPDKKGDQATAAPDGIEEARAQLDALRKRESQAQQARHAAEALARQRESENTQLREQTNRALTEVNQNRILTIDSSIEASKARADAAEREYQTAFEVGDAAKAAQAQRKLSHATADLSHYERQKNEAAQAARLPPGRVAPERQSAPDPIEVELQKFTPRTQEWLRSHPECITNQRIGNRALVAHDDAVDEGFSPDTDAYFDALDKKLGFKPDDASDVQVRAHTRTAPAAPVSRSGATGGKKSVVTLTEREAQAADDLGMTRSEYARRKMAMVKEGRYASSAAYE